MAAKTSVKKPHLAAEQAFKKQVVFDLLAAHKADGILLTAWQNRQWYTGFASSLGFLLITKKAAKLFLDGRYLEAGKQAVKNATVLPYTGFKAVGEAAKELGITKLLFEREYLTYEYAPLLDAICTDRVAVESKILRYAKTSSEVELTKKVIAITNKVAKQIPALLRPGITEFALAQKISCLLLEAGGDKNSFDPIVAAGANGSKPHHHPTDYKLKAGEFVTCDFGTTSGGYCSDITRTFAVGDKPTNQRLINAYRLVSKANRAGIKACVVGVEGKAVDKVCRDIIEEAKMGKYFVHSTGHGVGLDVHELPNNGMNATLPLPENAIVTVEPGIYIPGVGGIRIEDMVLVTKTGPVWLSKNIIRPEY